LPFSNKNYSYVLPLLLFDTLDLQDFWTTARCSTRGNHRAQHMQSYKREQLRTIHQSWKRLKNRIGFGSRNANTRNTENGTIVEKAHLSSDLYYNTKRLCAWYILFQRNTLFRIKKVIFVYKRMMLRLRQLYL
jgi:hypothetical protein